PISTRTDLVDQLDVHGFLPGLEGEQRNLCRGEVLLTGGLGLAGRGGIGSIELCLCVFGLRFEALLLVSLRLFHALDVDGSSTFSLNAIELTYALKRSS